MLKSKFLLPIVIGSLIIIVGILYLSGVFSPKSSSITQGERGIAITPKSAMAFLTDPDIERWAVVVGISDYKNNPAVTDLKYADRDAQSFYDFLVSSQGGCFKPENIQLLLNEKATVSNLRYALGTFLGRTADKDLVVIYMAGHGAPDTRKWENLYFLTYDADPDSLPNTAYPMDDLTRDLQRYIKSKKVIVVTDACHSAAVSGEMIAKRGNEGYRVNEYMKKLAESREGCTFITASRAGEGSQESVKWGGGHGVFTHFLLEGLKGKADYNGDGFITMKEAYDYLYSKVQRESENGQTPFASAYLDNSIPMGICEPDKLGIPYGIPSGITSKPKPGETNLKGSETRLEKREEKEKRNETIEKAATELSQKEQKRVTFINKLESDGFYSGQKNILLGNLKLKRFSGTLFHLSGNIANATDEDWAKDSSLILQGCDSDGFAWVTFKTPLTKEIPSLSIGSFIDCVDMDETVQKKVKSWRARRP